MKRPDGKMLMAFAVLMLILASYFYDKSAKEKCSARGGVAVRGLTLWDIECVKGVD